MSSGTSPYDAVVVGAGLSGLVAARRLVRAGAAIVVAEARTRVGGRTLTVPLGRGIADLGGLWISPTQDRVAALARELGTALMPQPRQGRAVIVHAEQRARGFRDRVPGWHRWELGRCMRAIDRASRMLDDHAASRAGSVGDWLAANVHTTRTRDMLGLLVGLLIGAEPDEVSFLYVLRMLAATSGLTGSELGGGEHRLAGGAQGLCTQLAAELGARIRLGCPVVRIEQDARGVTVHAGQRRWHARHVILALPPALLGRIDMVPPLPASLARAHAAMRMAPVIKCALAYERPFWRDRGLSGEAYAVSGVVRAAVDHSVPEQPALLCFVVGEAARALSGRPADERRRAVTEALVALLGHDAAGAVDYADMDWPADPWSGGCVAFFGPDAPEIDAEARRAPLGRLHLAGTESARRWPGYLDGAVEAGERAAAEVLARLAAGAP